ncbi:MAG: TetR/AcrR family transcriptional regulator [Sporichthyaceae bacterium]
MTELTGQAARWAGQRERRREEFVDAALRVIAERGPGVSVEDIAAAVGVARTRLYRHFDDRKDLERAISTRVAHLVVADLGPIWRPRGSARQMIAGAIGAYVHWLDANRNLHDYLLGHVRPDDDPNSLDGYVGVRKAVADHLARVFGTYLDLLGTPREVAADLAYAVVGMVESVTGRRDQPDGQSAKVDRLTAWTWAMLASVLADAGVELDPDLVLPSFFAVAPAGPEHPR